MTKSGARPYPRGSEGAIKAYISEIARLQAALGEAEGEITRLRAEERSSRGVRASARAFYRAVDDAVIARIDRRGYTRRPAKIATPTIPQNVLSSSDGAEIMEAIRRYDKAAYFRRRASKSGMLLRYRIISKTYRMARDAAVSGLRGAVRLARRVPR